MKYYSIAIMILIFPLTVFSLDLSNDTLAGKWKFTRIVAEDYEKSVKITMEFKLDGVVISYAATGQEFSRGTYHIEGDYIIYEDNNGVQKWQLKSISENRLHVDNRGAEMFFEK